MILLWYLVILFYIGENDINLQHIMKYFIGIITVHDYEMHETKVYETKIFKSSEKTLKAIELLTETVKSELLRE